MQKRKKKKTVVPGIQFQIEAAVHFLIDYYPKFSLSAR